jgi:GrpB-like predicted nucleotidyltransferase (UPF0157 family)
MTSRSPETLDQRIARVVREEIVVVPYDPAWPSRFEEEKARLLADLPAGLVRRIEHFGSTAVPGLAAKPVVDLLIEVTNLDEVKRRVVPLLDAQGCDYFWRPTWSDEKPFYAWFIRRDAQGRRTHHLHFVEAGFPQWDALRFRDLLRARTDLATEYQALKLRLAIEHPRNREAYTRGKADFIRRVAVQARPSTTRPNEPP